MTSMRGPVLDNNPPTGDKWEVTNIRWKFKNDTGGDICDLRIVVAGPWYSILPDIREVEVFDAAGTRVGNKDFDDVHDAHVTVSPCIGADQEFSVKVKFDSTFDLGETIQFSPTEKGGDHVVAVVTPIDQQFLAALTAAVPPVVGDVLTLGSLLPVPWTWSLWIFRIARWLRRMLPRTAAASALPAGVDFATLGAAVLAEFQSRPIMGPEVKARLREMFKEFTYEEQPQRRRSPRPEPRRTQRRPA